jgi:hypothetical protein
MRKDSKKDRTVHTSPKEVPMDSTTSQKKLTSSDLPPWAKETPELEESMLNFLNAGTEDPNLELGTTARFYGPKEL